MPYEVLATLEESDVEVPPRLTVAQRIERAIEGVDPSAAGNDSLFTIKGRV